MNRTIGCIGCGNMGSALLAGFAEKLDQREWRLCCFDRNPAKVRQLEALGVTATQGITDAATRADLLILAVKPNQLGEALDAVRAGMSAEKTVLSVAAGYSLARLRQQLGDQCAIARCMPTTTARAGWSVFGFCFDALNPGAVGLPWLTQLFGRLGYCISLSESQFPAFSALIGAGPAYLDHMLMGMEQAGVTLGFSRAQCRNMLAQLAAGCARLACKSDQSFSALRDEVCSPAGLTIEGVNELERAGFSGIIVDAVLAADKRAREMEA